VTRRILTMILAIVLAVIGTGAVLLYVRQADQRAMTGLRAVTVLVATQQIPAGTTAQAALANGLLSRQQLPARSVPADAVSSLAGVGGLVLSSPLPSGQLLLRPLLVTAVATGATLPIPKGKVALTVLMCVQKAVAGFIQPGSQIAVFNTFYTGGPVTASCSTADWSHAKNVHTRLVLNRVEVLAVGQASAGQIGAATSTAFGQADSPSSSVQGGTVLITVAVNQADAERLIEIAEAHVPYLALVTTASGTVPDINFQP
jgi:pilus assembly protein CpaB